VPPLLVNSGALQLNDTPAVASSDTKLGDSETAADLVAVTSRSSADTRSRRVRLHG